MTRSLLQPSSWVVRRIATGEVLFETFNPKVVEALNTECYEAVPILAYLQGLNAKALSPQVSGDSGPGHPHEFLARKRLFEIGNRVEGEQLTDEAAAQLGQELRQLSGLCPTCQGEQMGDEPDPVYGGGGSYACPQCAGISVLPDTWRPSESL